ncbi:MAG TPA: hypothetical protein VHK91_05360 [Flavisolibacter sp.]|jgi:hypothetical protein|nr:hypothetical protein [Flavisolibacter sp.]
MERNQKQAEEQDQLSSADRKQQQQTDPQLTELRGFTDPSVDLEPTLEDGQKAPDKAPPADVND